MPQRLTVALLAALVYVNALHNPFIYDDFTTIVTNRSIAPPLSLRAVVLHDVKRPVVNASYAIDRAAWGAKPFGFHVGSVVLHVLNALLLYQLAHVLLLGYSPDKTRDARWGAFAAAALFAVHPMMTEAVGYVSGRSELMCTTFLLIALLCGIRWIRTGTGQWIGLMLLAWVCALLSKETAAMLPFVLLVCDWFTADVPEAFIRRLKGLHLPLIAFSTVAGLARIVVLTRIEYPGRTVVHPDLVPLAIDVIVRYLRLMVLPDGQTLFHSVSAVAPLSGRAVVGYAVVAGLVVAGVAARRRLPVAGLGLVTFLLLLTPAAALTVLGSGEPMAEHRVYVASIGWFLAAGSIVAWLQDRAAQSTRLGRLLTGIMLGVVVAAFCTLTVLRNAIWSDPVAVWKESAELAPHHPRPRMLLGEALEDQGRRREAAPEYEAAVRLGPADPVAHLKLGLCLAALSRFDEARSELQETLRLDPGNLRAQRSLALIAQIRPAT